jgi:hypothetical protein
MAAGSPIIAQLLQKMGAGGASGPGGMQTDDSGAGVAQMSSELHGADPAFLLKSLQAIKQQLSQIFVQSSMRLPNVAANVAKTMTTLDRAIKEAQQAAATQSVVRSPIGFNLAGGPGGSPSGSGPSLGGGGF